MWKRALICITFGTFGMLTACAAEEYSPEQLTRVDVLSPGNRGNSEEHIIVDENALEEYREVLAAVDWQPDRAKSAGKPDVTAVLFYEVDKNLPERLFEHNISFSEDGTAVIASNNEEEGYGTLSESAAETLRSMFKQ